MENNLTNKYMIQAVRDVGPHIGEFDFIVVGGDPHATALGAIVAAILNKPLMIVCMNDHDCALSHITTIGDVDPRSRALYVDDFFSYGATLRKVMDYLSQSRPANVVATYEAVTREYEPLDDSWAADVVRGMNSIAPDGNAPQYPPSPVGGSAPDHDIPQPDPWAEKPPYYPPF